jgi:hypothetical protein
MEGDPHSGGTRLQNIPIAEEDHTAAAQKTFFPGSP